MSSSNTRMLARTLIRELSDEEQKAAVGGCNTSGGTCCAPDWEIDDGCQTSSGDALFAF